MGLREYAYAGGTYQFLEGQEPVGAVRVEVKVKPAPANKARQAPADKEATSEGSRTRRKSRPAVPAES